MASANQRRGKSFEQDCAERVNTLGLLLSVKRVIKERYVTAPDLEFLDFPEYVVDCKFTISSFTRKEKQSLYKKTKMKYGNKVILILGQRLGKSRLSWDNITVYYYYRGLFVEVLYDDWLRYNDRRIKQCLVKNRRNPLPNPKRNKR